MTTVYYAYMCADLSICLELSDIYITYLPDLNRASLMAYRTSADSDQKTFGTNEGYKLTNQAHLMLLFFHE